ncbi:hypothetical protein [Nocardioides zeicaulis]|uniref:Uncharacterized protein n=1 Tax=Nocardioides zeicaulis TaxID=1776857 RepID=A0ABV6DYX6_9ACTN
MSSRRPVRQLLVAVLLGVLVGGGLMAVTPAGAEVSQAAATSWKKIWKKELKPLAAKAFYTKSKANQAFATKAESAAGDAAANAATDTKLGSYYKKSEIDAKLAPFVNAVAATAGGDQSLALASTDLVTRSVSLMPPANGTVVVSSSGQIETTTAGIARCSISLSNAFDFAAVQNMSGAAGDYSTAAGTRGFPVTKGTLFTANLVCNEYSGQHVMWDSSLTAIFAPN